MPASRDVRRGALLAVSLAVALAGCGAQDVHQRAKDDARADLPDNVAEVLECLGSRATALLAGASEADLLTSELGECAGTTVLDQDDEAVRTAVRLDMVDGTVALSTDAGGEDLVLRFYTEGGGYAEAGVTQARYQVGTCWQVPVTASGDLGAPSGVECSRAVVERANPAEVLPFDELDLSAG